MNREGRVPVGWMAVVLAGAMGCAGCAGSGRLSLSGATTVDISRRFDTAVFAVEGSQSLNVVMVSGPEDDPQQVLHLQVFFVPEAGRTPLGQYTTNTVVRYVVFDGQGAALYGGAGLMKVSLQIGGSILNATLSHANLRLLDASEGYTDRLVRPWADGTIRAERDAGRVMRLMERVNRKLSGALGYPRLARAGDQWWR